VHTHREEESFASFAVCLTLSFSINERILCAHGDGDDDDEERGKSSNEEFVG
jgi:hypothetical protein